MDVSMIYGKYSEIDFFSAGKIFMSNGMKQLKGFIVRNLDISLYILDSYSKGKARIKKISSKKLTALH